jgi:hypothetical protein
VFETVNYIKEIEAGMLIGNRTFLGSVNPYWFQRDKKKAKSVCHCDNFFFFIL